MDAGELKFDEAVNVARDVLFENANRIYKLGWTAENKCQEQTSSLGDSERQNFDQTLDILVMKGVKAIRVIWVDIRWV